MYELEISCLLLISICILVMFQCFISIISMKENSGNHDMFTNLRSCDQLSAANPEEIVCC